MTEKDLKIQDLRAENQKLREELEQLKQPKAVVDIERLTYRDEKGNPHSDHIMWDIINRLAEYEDLEEQGLLLRLLYPLETDEVFLADEDSRDIYCLDAREFSPFKMDSDSEIIYRIDCHDFSASDFGRILFLTEQEAQAALEKMKGE